GDDDATDHEGCGDNGVGQEVQEGAADVEVVLAVAHEQEGGHCVDHYANGGDDGDGLTGKRFWGHQAVDGFVADGAEGDQQDGCVEERDEDGRLFITVGIIFGGFDLEEADGDEGHGQRGDVGEVVACVGKQRKGMDGKAYDDFDDHKKEVQ